MERDVFFVFLPSFGGGGAEKVVSALSSKFSDSYELYLFVLNDNGPNRVNISKNVNLVKLKSKKIYFVPFELAYYFKKLKPKYLFTTLIYPIAVLSTLIPFFKSRTKFICRLSNIPSLELNCVRSHIIKYLYVRSLSRYDAVVCQSQDMLLDASEFTQSSKNLIKINNPVFFNNKDSNTVSYRNRFILIGRLSKQKNINMAIIAANEAGVRLDIYGQGECYNELNDLINNLGNDDIKLCGFSSNIHTEITSSLAVLLTSEYEGFPNVLIESISLGVPVVARNCPGGINEIVNSNNGIIFETKDQLVSILKNFQSDNFNSDFMKRDIQSRFSLERIVNNYIELFRSL
ncbi:glycosyltransferase [Vibrio alginolyticus]|uniref:glycosyltransferase n=1 Tax=Vibrio diabolicus TaxID=50719 RepID=UPI0031CCDB43|nr:glycosyltransferase [Vibrio alginolyticus]